MLTSTFHNFHFILSSNGLYRYVGKFGELEEKRTLVLFSPLIALIIFGIYSVAVIAYRSESVIFLKFIVKHVCTFFLNR
jgi:hypothetical protein